MLHVKRFPCTIPYYSLKDHVAGKTGTPEVEDQQGKYNVVWFISFAPVENPQIAIAVVIVANQSGVAIRYTSKTHK
jgi:cell division protein FtsI/penicillin-binding protein 2